MSAQPDARRIPSVRKGTGSFALMQVLKIATAFVVAALVSRQLGPAGKGELALVQQVPSIMALVMGFGFAGVNVYYVGRRKKSPAEAFSDSVVISAIALLAGVPLSVAVMSLLPALDGVALGVLALSALAVPVAVFSAQLAGILVGTGRPSTQALASSVALAANALVVGVLYVTVRLSTASVVGASLVTSTVGIVIMLAAVREPFRPRGFVQRVRSASHYARRRYFTEVAAMLEMRVDIVMLGMLSTAAAVGVYSVAVSIVELLWFVPRAAETPLLSRFLHDHDERGADLAALSVRLTVVLEVVMLLTAAVLLKPAVALVFGPSFAQATRVFWVLAPGVVSNGLVGPLVSYLTSRGHQYPGLAAVSVAGNIALNLALIPLLGVVGAALASSVTYAAGAVWLVWRFRAETGYSLSGLFVPRRTDLSALLPSRS